MVTAMLAGGESIPAPQFYGDHRIALYSTSNLLVFPFKNKLTQNNCYLIRYLIFMENNANLKKNDEKNFVWSLRQHPIQLTYDHFDFVKMCNFQYYFL